MFCYVCCTVLCLVTHSCPTLATHRLQPTRLLCPWDSPGKNTGVGCHFLLQYFKLKPMKSLDCPFNISFLYHRCHFNSNNFINQTKLCKSSDGIIHLPFSWADSWQHIFRPNSLWQKLVIFLRNFSTSQFLINPKTLRVLVCFYHYTKS